jgi:hypothetical protein
MGGGGHCRLLCVCGQQQRRDGSMVFLQARGKRLLKKTAYNIDPSIDQQK